MRFTFGEVKKLKGTQWYLLEFQNNRLIESYLKRVITYVKDHFKRHAFEMVVPVRSRDLDEFELLEAGLTVYVRSDYTQGLLALWHMQGINGLSTRGSTNFPKDLVKVDDSYIKKLQKIEDDLDKARASAIQVGSKVRVLDGKMRDFTGEVVAVSKRRIQVKISAIFREVLLSTFPANLKLTDHDWYTLRTGL